MGEIFTTTIHIGRESTGSQYNTAFGTNDASAVRGTNYRTDDAAVIVDDQVLASVFTRRSTPTFSADWINRPIRAVPLTSCILRWWVAISQTCGMTREAEYAQPFGDSCEADRIFCKSGPAMMPMPKNEVG